jgi:hypothetical protein
VWRPMMFLFCLIAAVAGTPLRQAEAATDFARSHGEIGQGNVIEIIDGGVGDDSGAAILRAGRDTQSRPAIALMALAEALHAPLLHFESRPDDVGCRADRLTSLPAISAQRHALLQCFLF